MDMELSGVEGAGGVERAEEVGVIVAGVGVGVGTEEGAEAVGEVVGAEEVEGVEGEGVDENYPSLVLVVTRPSYKASSILHLVDYSRSLIPPQLHTTFNITQLPSGPVS